MQLKNPQFIGGKIRWLIPPPTKKKGATFYLSKATFHTNQQNSVRNRSKYRVGDQRWPPSLQDQRKERITTDVLSVSCQVVLSKRTKAPLRPSWPGLSGKWSQDFSQIYKSYQPSYLVPTIWYFTKFTMFG